ncbi:NADH dehydrogenase [ubiquinone] 1 beta subcomplex subunit 7 isoform X2 [Tachysurus fulvidraco]|uniref:NADH dehydrogenase [ubiquinone] 1 beta subcomplex subunit 7 isoform X2 n=1 Tax=Tachysurus fulvidraco TaxID=1234273 RepID=UPI000F500733|nr:NADH dehydrogenase [ubiquinone] 1 beta subcomplex subunit 7 isoform X2 [Tachysurus fulvidraco]
MGSHLVRSYITERDTVPDPKGPFQSDPQFGFTEERKERERNLRLNSKCQLLHVKVLPLLSYTESLCVCNITLIFTGTKRLRHCSIMTIRGVEVKVGVKNSSFLH